jgi:glucokinase
MTKYVLGIDLGGTNTVAGIVNANGEILAEFCFKTAEYSAPTLLMEAIYRSYLQFSQEKGIYVSGVGIGAPNGNYYKGTIEFAPNLNWGSYIPIATITEQYFSVPVKVINDANAAAIGEKHFGCARNMTDFVVLTLGTGLGSGIYVNNQILNGKNGFAGEFGHTKCLEVKRKCSCGLEGCFETVVSARGIKQTYEELYLQQYHRLPENISVIQIHELAKLGDKIALDTYTYTAKVLAHGAANLVMIFDLEAVILFGGIAHAHPILIPVMMEELNKLVLPVFRNKVSILPSCLLHKNAAVLGSAALLFNN